MTASGARDGHEPPPIPLWPDGPPATLPWPADHPERTFTPPGGSRMTRNVSHSTLTPFLPAPHLATGAAMVVAPGGGFQFLMLDKEGMDVVRWLNARGVAAFLLKYRLLTTAPADDDFAAEVRARRDPGQNLDAFRRRQRQVIPLAAEDGRQAIRLVRRRASEWALHPDRIGIVGFSAGGIVAAHAALSYDAESRPVVAAPIYGAPREPVTAPPDAPPLFLAVANDDTTGHAATSVHLAAARQAAARSVELHLYATGGHGFALKRQELPSDGWIDSFERWLHLHRIVPQPAPQNPTRPNASAAVA